MKKKNKRRIQKRDRKLYLFRNSNSRNHNYISRIPNIQSLPLISDKNSRFISVKPQILEKNEAFSVIITKPLVDTPCVSRRRRRRALFSKGLIGKVHFAKWTNESLERC